MCCQHTPVMVQHSAVEDWLLLAKRVPTDQFTDRTGRNHKTRGRVSPAPAVTGPRPACLHGLSTARAPSTHSPCTPPHLGACL